MIRVDLVFNVDTVIDNYAIGFATSLSDVFQLTGVNGTSGQNSFGSRRTTLFDMGTIPVFLAGEAYTLTHNTRIATISAFGVSSPSSPAVVPLPAALPLLLAGLVRRRA